MRWSKTASYLLTISIIISLYGCDTGSERIVSDALRETSVEKLQSTLQSDLRWEKVHAAEFLLNLGYTNTIYDVFLEEEKQKGEQYYYRIGIWRVMAQASLRPEEKQQWLDSISMVFKDPGAPDQIHATESLAKLGVSLYSVSIETTDSILNGRHNQQWVYTLWGTANTSDREMNMVKNRLAGIIGQKNEPIENRRLAAYALRNLKDIGIRNWDLLIQTACHEPAGSIAYSYILSSALVHAPEDSLLSARLLLCRHNGEMFLGW